MKNEKRKWDGWWKDWIIDVTLAQDMTIALIGLEMRSGYDIESVATICSIKEGGTCTAHGWPAEYRVVVSKARENEGVRDGEENRGVGEVEPSGFGFGICPNVPSNPGKGKQETHEETEMNRSTTEIIHMSLVNIRFLRKVFGESMRIGR